MRVASWVSELVRAAPQFHVLDRKEKGFVDENDGKKRSKSGDSWTGVAKVDADVEEHAPETGGICSVEEADAGRLASQEREAYGVWQPNTSGFTSWTALHKSR
jgi:hypothetical protein